MALTSTISRFQQIMALITLGTPITEVLEAIIFAVQAEDPDIACSVYLLDPDTRLLRLAAAPSLPAQYRVQVNEAPMAPDIGSCPAAAYSNQRVICEDVLTDPRWELIRSLVADTGLRACWSQPIRGAQGEVLGTFAIYRRRTGAPTEGDVYFLEAAAELASLAIGRVRGEEALRAARQSAEAAEVAMRHLALHDTLTGLANRTAFNERLAAHLAADGHGPGLLLIDLDGFKQVNDTRGHHVGDELLRLVAGRLRRVCDGRRLDISRLGGDEFAVLIPHDQVPAAEHLAARIIDSLSQPYALGADTRADVSASIGIALAPRHGNTGQALLSRADLALYAAKAAGKSTYRLFCENLENRIQERSRLRAHLQAALQGNDGLFVFYQPVLDGRTRKVTTREALARWHDPQRGWTAPREFIPVAESCDLIDQIGDFVLNRACQEAAAWQDDARVAVNISAAQLGKGTLAPAVQAALTRSGLPPVRLELEITEGAMLGDEHDGIADLHLIRGMGVHVVLDDFGTGNSSLTRLRAFPFDKIKIDGSVVHDALEHLESAACIHTIAALGRRLGLTTVAEGVETQAHLQLALAEGCVEVQGYFCGRPAPAARDADAVAMLTAIPADKESTAA